MDCAGPCVCCTGAAVFGSMTGGPDSEVCALGMCVLPCVQYMRDMEVCVCVCLHMHGKCGVLDFACDVFRPCLYMCRMSL